MQLNYKSNKKVATPTFLHHQPLSPFQSYPSLSSKIFGTPPPQVTQFLEGPTIPLIRGRGIQI